MEIKEYILAITMVLVLTLIAIASGCIGGKSVDITATPTATINVTVTPSDVPSVTINVMPTSAQVLKDTRVTGIVVDKGITPTSDSTFPIIRLNNITGPYNASEIASWVYPRYGGSPDEIGAIVNRTVWNQISVGDKVLLEVEADKGKGFPSVLCKIE